MRPPQTVVFLRCLLRLLLLVHAGCVADDNKTEGCSQVFSAERPVLISSRHNGSTSPVHCSYSVHMPSSSRTGRVFQVSIEHFSVGERTVSGGACHDGWVRIGKSLYCGPAVAPNTFLLVPTNDHTSHLSLVVHPSGKNHNFQARVELLTKLTLQERHHEMVLVTPGKNVPFTECDRIYNCLEYPGYCQVTSPSYPGAYPRPMNCSYFLKSPESGVIIGGRFELFEVGGGSRLMTGAECDLEDRLEVIDGGELVMKFCGKAKKFPKIVTKTKEIVVRFVTTHVGPPSKGFALSIERSPPHISEHQMRCSQTIKVGSMVESLKSPHHWLAPNSHCTCHLVAKPGKQIWLTLKTVRTRSKCLDADEYVQVWDGNKLMGRVCSNNSLDHPLVSSSNQLKIVYVSPNGTLDATSRLFFHTRFAAVSAMETGSHVQGSWCDTHFDAVQHLGGPFALLSPKEILLEQYKELGYLVCKYKFLAPEGHTVRLEMNHASFEPLFKCSNSVCDPHLSRNVSYDRLVVTEEIESLVLGCECGGKLDGKHHNAHIYHSRGSEMLLSLHLHLNSELIEATISNSPELYQFQGRYQFVAPDEHHLHCGHGDFSNQNSSWVASFVYPVAEKYVNSPILCHWTVQGNVSRLRLEKLSLARDCRNNFLAIKTQLRSFKLCHNTSAWNFTLEEPIEGFEMYLMASKGVPQVHMFWHSGDQQQSSDECYDILTLTLLMGGAAVFTMSLVLVVVVLIWRTRRGMWTLCRQNGEQRYNTVTRQSAFW